MTVTPWMLGRGIKTEDGTQWVNDRVFSDAEYLEFARADSLLQVFNSPAVLGRYDETRREFGDLSNRLLEVPMQAKHGANGIAFARSFEAWLSQFVATRRRLIRGVGDSFGDGAANDADALFDAAYHADHILRLVWELRSLSEHGTQVLRLTKISMRGVKGGSVTLWDLDITSVYAAMTRGKDRAELEALLGTAKIAGMRELIEDATSSLYSLALGVLRQHVDALRDAARVVLSLNDELQARPGGPIVFNFSTEPNEGRAGLPVQFSLVRDDLASSLIHTLDQASQLDETTR